MNMKLCQLSFYCNAQCCDELVSSGTMHCSLSHLLLLKQLLRAPRNLIKGFIKEQINLGFNTALHPKKVL